MQSNKKLKDKSAGSGFTSYRITSYLTLSQTTATKKAQERGEELQLGNDMFDEGVLVATDLDPKSVGKTKKDKKGKKTRTRRTESPVERIKKNLGNIKEMFTNTVMYPFSVFAFYLDIVLDNIALITQNMGAILALAYKAVVRQAQESEFFQGKEVEEELPEEDQFPEEEQVDNVFEPNQGVVDENGEELYNQYDEQGNKKISFLDLHELNISFTDNKNAPLFTIDIRKTQTYRPSPMVIDPIATKVAIEAIKECAERAASIPPAMEGPYANMPLQDVLSNIDEPDLQSFLRYVKVYPGNYVGRNLKISETFATWVVYGAPSP
ncbi:MAG: hypothetical protein U0457_21310 [Candidatus Sericytochromatia bacterium]